MLTGNRIHIVYKRKTSLTRAPSHCCHTLMVCAAPLAKRAEIEHCRDPIVKNRRARLR